jgi:[ribosomal protein S5]-alanine N-acetyltransferase
VPVQFATPIVTDRLLLIPATRAHVEAELEGNTAFGELLNAMVPPSWPPGAYDRDAQEYFLKSLSETGELGVGWFGWYAVRQANPLAHATVIGCGGYFGPPTRDGVVEIGYSICPEWQGNGFATEMTRALVEHVLQQANVSAIVAHTDAENTASMAVLQHSGFAQAEHTDQAGALLFEWTPVNVSV